LFVLSDFSFCFILFSSEYLMASPNSDLLLLNVEFLQLSSLDKHFAGRIQTKWEEKNLSTFSSMADQISALIEVYNPSSPRNPWLLSLSKVALAFGITKVRASRLICHRQNHLLGVPKMPHHRPPKILLEQLEFVRKFISDREVNEKDPPEPMEVCNFIENTFGIEYHRMWINVLVKKHTMFHIVDADPLESVRIDVLNSDLTRNHAELSKLLLSVDPRLLVNLDESGWGKKINQQKKKVVSLSPFPTFYREQVEEGHITFIPISWANGDFSRSMIILQTKSIQRELTVFGIPNGAHNLVVASQKGKC
jgi:hypothetical protein